MKRVWCIPVFALIVSLLLSLTILAAPLQDSDRAKDIKQWIAAIENQDLVEAAIAADEALKSEDPILRSMVLSKILSNKNPRIRAIGFAYLVENQKRIVIEASAPEATISKINPADKNYLLDSLTQECIFSEFDKKTLKFKVDMQRLGGGNGAIGQDGISFTIRSNMINLYISEGGYLVGTMSLKLSNTPGLVSLPAKAALP